MENLKNECSEKNIGFWSLVVFKQTICENFYNAHRNEKEVLSLLEERRKAYNESNEYRLKNILQNDYILSPTAIKYKIKEKTYKAKKKCFKFLETLEDPYKFIFDSLYFWNTYNCKYDLYEDFDGFGEISKFIANEYAMYKIFGLDELGYYTIDDRMNSLTLKVCYDTN